MSCQPSFVRALVFPAVAAGVLVASGCASEDISPDAVPVSVLDYNIGNPNADDEHYPLRLKDQAYEDHLGQELRALAPDVVFLQEVLPPTHCATFTETDAAYTCYDAANRESPIRRLLGDDYSIVCDARQHVECIGVRVGFGVIDGVTPGGFVLDGAATPPLPMDACNYAAGECSDDACDAEATVSAVTVTTDFGDLRVVHVHPNAAGANDMGVYTGAPCRARQLTQVFEGLAGFGDDPLVTSRPTLIGGDFNMDPVRLASDEEEALWQRHVGPGQRFVDLNPVDAEGLQFATHSQNFGLAIDHVLADRVTGGCMVHGDDAFGSDAGTLPLDAGFDWSQMPDGEFYASRIDHFALSCDLTMDLSTP
jgi:endonuclease/exonuclease/phosphatase family metal-dependent hydrolase